MRAYSRETVAHRLFALAIPLFVAAWLVTPTNVIGTSSFVALVALLSGLAWIVTATYKNAQPAASLAQALHDADADGSRTTPRHG